MTRKIQRKRELATCARVYADRLVWNVILESTPSSRGQQMELIAWRLVRKNTPSPKKGGGSGTGGGGSITDSRLQRGEVNLPSKEKKKVIKSETLQPVAGGIVSRPKRDAEAPVVPSEEGWNARKRRDLARELYRWRARNWVRHAVPFTSTRPSRAQISREVLPMASWNLEALQDLSRRFAPSGREPNPVLYEQIWSEIELRDERQDPIPEWAMDRMMSEDDFLPSRLELRQHPREDDVYWLRGRRRVSPFDDLFDFEDQFNRM